MYMQIMRQPLDILRMAAHVGENRAENDADDDKEKIDQLIITREACSK